MEEIEKFDKNWRKSEKLQKIEKNIQKLKTIDKKVLKNFASKFFQKNELLIIVIVGIFALFVIFGFFFEKNVFF